MNLLENLIQEFPYPEYKKDKPFDIESEKGSKHIKSLLSDILLKKQVKDKYNTTMQLKTDKQIDRFLKNIKIDIDRIENKDTKKLLIKIFSKRNI